MPQIFKMEPRSASKRLGLTGCNVSVPLSQSEVLDTVKKWDNNPNPEQNQEWIKLIANQKSGDELRMVSCKVGDPYFYALFRNDAILYKFHPVILD
ncbi:hypothetical protein [Solilutibacter silvestris]|nr:hypothetical protein [Lysobacter silvestris]